MVNIIVLQKAQFVELSTNLKWPVQWWISQYLYVVETLVWMRILLLFGEMSVKIQVSQFRHRAQELRLSLISTWRILRKDLDHFPYKIQLTQELKPNDYLQRQQFADWTLEELEIDPDFGKNNHLYRRSPFSVKWLRKQARLSHFGVSVTHKRFDSVLYTPKKSLFGLDFGLAVSSDLISFKMMPELHSLSTASGIDL